MTTLIATILVIAAVLLALVFAANSPAFERWMFEEDLDTEYPPEIEAEIRAAWRDGVE